MSGSLIGVDGRSKRNIYRGLSFTFEVGKIVVYCRWVQEMKCWLSRSRVEIGVPCVQSEA
jgi:hypothetical protein